MTAPLTTPKRRLSFERDLSDSFGLSDKMVRNAFGLIGIDRIDDFDLYFQKIRQESWELEGGVVKSGNFKIDQGVGVRATAGEKSAYAYSSDIDERTVLEAARTVRSIVAAGQTRQVDISTAPSSAVKRSLYTSTNPLDTLNSEQKVDLLKKVETLCLRRDPRIKRVTASLGTSYDEVLIVRPNGSWVTDLRPMIRLKLVVIAESNGRREMGSSDGGGRYGLDFFCDSIIAAYVEKAVSMALTNLESRAAPAGKMPVILGPGWPGTLLHEAVGHGLEGDFNVQGSSTFSNRIGERVAAKGVTIVDDGTLPNRRGSLNIDDEGHASQQNILIEDGILKGYMHNQLSARLLGVAPTGNGRRQNYTHPPLPRMTNTYMLPGAFSAEEILSSVKRGLYVTNVNSGQVDITSGTFVFSATEAFWVENGQVKYPVKGATLIGNGPLVLTRMSMIGNDLALDSGGGVCGKENQLIPVCLGQPTLRIDDLTVGGSGA